MRVEGLGVREAEALATIAVAHARRNAPKLTGHAASTFVGVFGENFFGVHWTEDYVWFTEAGTRPFVMRKLAGKTIPMWLDDPTGEIKARNPKAHTRILSGRPQTLIFRRAAPIGQRKLVRRERRGVTRTVDVPASYPGAPGRIARRVAPAPENREGYRGGQVSPGNVGLRWYHPGIMARRPIEQALRLAARDGGVIAGRIQPVELAA